jgi:hypothetical protein
MKMWRRAVLNSGKQCGIHKHILQNTQNSMKDNACRKRNYQSVDVVIFYYCNEHSELFACHMFQHQCHNMNRVTLWQLILIVCYGFHIQCQTQVSTQHPWLHLQNYLLWQVPFWTPAHGMLISTGHDLVKHHYQKIQYRINYERPIFYNSVSLRHKSYDINSVWMSETTQ